MFPIIECHENKKILLTPFLDIVFRNFLSWLKVIIFACADYISPKISPKTKNFLADWVSLGGINRHILEQLFITR